MEQLIQLDLSELTPDQLRELYDLLCEQMLKIVRRLNELEACERSPEDA